MTDQERRYFDILKNKKEIAARYILEDFSFRGVRESVTEKYSDQAHFIYELLQNADDAHATQARFILEPERLIFAHNGTRHFSVSNPDTEKEDHEANKLGDLNSITGIGNSNKDESRIGKFGVGFKAVFQYTVSPSVFDPNIRFKLEKMFVPSLLKEDFPGRAPDETLFVFPFNHPSRTSEIAFKDILNKLQNLVFPLLFLSSLNEITYSTQGGLNGSYSKKKHQTIIFDSVTAERYSLIVDKGSHKKEDELWLFSKSLSSGLKICTGFFLNENGTVMPVSYPAFCYFPTKEITGLKFIIHAPFKLTDSREGIQAGYRYNNSLIKSLAELAADSLSCLREIEKDPLAKKRLIEDSILQVIPTDSGSFSAPDDNDRVSFLPFYTAITKTLQTKELIPTKDGYVKLTHAYWAMGRQYPDLFSSEQLSEITGDPHARWAFPTIAREDLIRAKSPLVQYIDKLVRTNITEEAIIRGRKEHDVTGRQQTVPIPGITEIFIEKQTISWLRSFYRWLLESQARVELAKRRPLFWNEEGRASAVYDEGGHLILFYPAEGVTGYNVVHPDLIRQEDAKKLLDRLGVKQPELRDQIYNKILPLYKNDGELDTRQHFNLFFDYYCKCSEDEQDELIKQIRSLNFLRCSHCGEDKVYRSKGDNLYFPSPLLLSYFKGQNVWFVEYEEYRKNYEKDRRKVQLLHPFLRELGVHEAARVSQRRLSLYENKDSFLKYRRLLPSPSPCTEGPSYTEKEIDGCKALLSKINENRDPELSITLWNMLVKLAEENCSLYYLTLERFLGGTCTYKYRTWKEISGDSTDTIELRRTSWLLTRDGRFAAPSEIEVSNLDLRYNLSSESAGKVIAFLKFAQHVEKKQTDQSHLTEEERSKIGMADSLIAAGITQDELPSLLRLYEKEKAEKVEMPTMPIPRGEIDTTTKEKENDTFEDSWSKGEGKTHLSRRQDIVLRDIAKRASAESETNDGTSYFDVNKILEQDVLDDQIDQDDLIPKTVDYKKQLERAKNKSALEVSRIARLEELQVKAQSAKKYSFGWFKALLELEGLSRNETGLRNREISISFAKVDRDPHTIKYLILSRPNRYIPQYMEELSDIPLVLHLPNGQRKVPIEVTSVKDYTLRVKMKDPKCVDDIDLSAVAEARIDASSPAFLHEELKKRFSELPFNDEYDMRDNLTPDIEFVFGPPGTGKTTYLADNVLLRLIRIENARILVLAPTNQAADVLTKRIMSCALESDAYKNWLVRFGTTDDETVEKEGVYREKTFDPGSMQKMVLVTTIARLPYDFIMAGSQKLFLAEMKWDYIVIDEASMIPLANVIFPLYKKTPKKFIIAGDPFQIEPITMVDMWKDENIYTMVGLKSFVNPETYPHRYIVRLLTKQYRSVPAIGRIFSHFSYGGVLHHHRETQDRLPLSLGGGKQLSTVAILKFPVSPYESIYRAKYLQGSSYQVYSALFVFEYTHYLAEQLAIHNAGRLIKIGIIAPYRAQADLIAKLTQSVMYPDTISVHVGTIHGFQGDECDIVFAVFNPPPRISSSGEMFLNKQNIVNVAISRARDCLFIVMPDNDTEGIQNLVLVKRVEKLCGLSGECECYTTSQLEALMFNSPTYLSDNSFSTGHQSVNVYGLPEKIYEVRTEDSAVDVQVHKIPGAKSGDGSKPSNASTPEGGKSSEKVSVYRTSAYGSLNGDFAVVPYEGKLKKMTSEKLILYHAILTRRKKQVKVPIMADTNNKALYIQSYDFDFYKDQIVGKRISLVPA